MAIRFLLGACAATRRRCFAGRWLSRDFRSERATFFGFAFATFTLFGFAFATFTLFGFAFATFTFFGFAFDFATGFA